eukprot:g701.t1
MGGGQSTTVKSKYEPSEDKEAQLMKDLSSKASSETLVAAQMKARRKKKGRTGGITGGARLNALDISKSGAIVNPNPVPKLEETIKTIKRALETHFLFHALPPSSIMSTLSFMEKVVVPSGKNIITQGEQGTHFYVLEKGSAKVIVDNKDLNKVLPSGTSFGELALLYSEPRSASIVATEQCELWALESQIFRRSLASQDIAWHGDISNVLKNIPMLKELKENDFRLLTDGVQEVMIPDGTSVIKQGDPGNVFYMVLDGEANVYVWDDEKTKNPIFVRTIGQYSFFGERALLSDEPRSATVVAKGNLKCGAIDREAFNYLIGPLKNILNETRVEQDKSEQQRRKTHEESMSYKCGLQDLETRGVLGRGAFGFVFLVRNKLNDERYAMKKISKVTVVEKAQEENIVREKLLLAGMDHPFLPRLYLTAQDKDCLYLVIELLQGGDLFSALVNRPDQVFDRDHSVFYTACIVEALDYMHQQDVIYRDLKPENVVVSSTGVAKLVDFGFAKRCKRSFTVCGTQDYIAPEMILGRGHGKGVDYWALGNVVFEFIYGYLPFQRETVADTFSAIVSGDLEFDHFNEVWLTDANSLIKRLLTLDVSKRYGCGHKGAEPIKATRFFEQLDWEQLVQLKLDPPTIPKCKDPDDVSNFKDVDVEGIHAGVAAFKGNQTMFRDF